MTNIDNVNVFVYFFWNLLGLQLTWINIVSNAKKKISFIENSYCPQVTEDD